MHVDSFAPGAFSFVDLSAHDMAAIIPWYAALFDWTYKAEDTAGGPPYGMFWKDGRIAAGLGETAPELRAAGVPPLWNSYIQVEDVAATVAKVEAAGGTVMLAPMAVLDAGTMAVVADPQGAVVCLWQPDKHSGCGVVNEPGSFTWNELNTTDLAAAREFYGAVFGWTFEAMPGPTAMVTASNAGEMNCSMLEMNAQWEGMPPAWSVYFAVADCDATCAAIEASGGKVHVPPTDIPPGRFAVVADPQGAVFHIIRLAPHLA
jgi:predicted enzyme related to lactoylglutathione lyase